MKLLTPTPFNNLIGFNLKYKRCKEQEMSRCILYCTHFIDNIRYGNCT